MMGKTLQKCISAFIVLCIVLHPVAIIIAQEVTPTDAPTLVSPTPSTEPTVAPTEEVTPTPEVGEIVETLEHTATDATSEGYFVNPTTGATVYNSGDGTHIDISSTDNSTVAIANNNDIDVNKNVTDTSDTGNNTASDNISLGGTATEIKTGDASSFQNILTVINTNILASSADALLVNIFDPSYQPIDLSQTSSCNAQTMLNTPDILNVVNTGNNVKIIDNDSLNSSTRVDNNNIAHITNTVDVSANTGNNQAIDNIGSATKVETGNATIGLNMLNIANTNLVGNCWFYGVVNLFGSQTGDIILPYEYDILNGDSQGFVFNRNQTGVVNTGDNTEVATNATTNLNTKIANNNSATVNTVVNTTTTTGNNSITDAINFDDGQTITSGAASSIVTILDMLNTNIVGNKFFALRINKFGNWTGTVRGWMGNILEFPDYVLLYNGQFPMTTPTPTPDPTQATDVVNTGDATTIQDDNVVNNSINIANNNSAQIDNTINLSATTGDNTAGKFNAHITTGNATIATTIFNMINTNIVGDNWFYAVVNIFNNFVGDIVFPRPDLAVSSSANATWVQNGDTTTITDHIANNGSYKADSVVVTDTLPKNAAFISASDNGVFNGNTVTWNLGKMDKSIAHDLSVTVRFGSDALQNELLQNTCTVTTTTPEQITANNNAAFDLSFFIPAPQQQSSNSGTSVGNNGGSGGGSGSTSGGGSSNNNNSGSNNNQQPNFWSDQNYTYQWVSYTSRVYNRKTKKWEKKIYRKLVKKLIKKIALKKTMTVKNGKKLTKATTTLKLKRKPLKLQTFTKFYSSIFSKI